jgi:hypothetical protein
MSLKPHYDSLSTRYGGIVQAKDAGTEDGLNRTIAIAVASLLSVC